MLSRLLLHIYLVYGASLVVAQSGYTICTPGSCYQSPFPITIGANLSANDPTTNLTSVQLLPGLYNSTTTSQPQNLLDLLTLLSNSSATLSLPHNFNSSSVSSSLSIFIKPGLALYGQDIYGGQATFLKLSSTPMNATPFAANVSFILSNNVWLAALGSNNTTIIFWNEVPDITGLPNGIGSQSLALIDLQSSTCSPPCSSAGVCSASNTCSCAPGFTGSACEKCLPGFFGPRCQPVLPVGHVPSECNCVNGICSKGQCACNIGWTTAKNGTACARCAEGYYLTSTGDCRICGIGCSKCSADSGACTSCEKDFILDSNKCNLKSSITSKGVQCPTGAFSNDTQCSSCLSPCSTCIGSASNCIQCSKGTSFFNGTCVQVDGDGVCEGTNGMIVNNDKEMCDTCGAKCTTCEIPNFDVTSTISQLQCTACLPGAFLVKGQCVDSCPSGTFGPQNSTTCAACSSECSTCIGSADNCLTCNNQQFALSGTCFSTCPTGFYNSNSTCLKCHRDCASCSGPSFNQCSTCPMDRPVLDSGRCLRTCANSTLYFDYSTSSCQPCDSSCASCSGPGKNSCLACSVDSSILRNGTCLWGSCTVIPGFGICFPSSEQH